MRGTSGCFKGGGDTALKPGYWKDEEKEIAQLGFTSFKVKDDV